jgi:hypothetical protein
MMPGMNNQPLRPDATGPDRTADRLPTYSIAEMAVMLGVSTDAVRARINRGTLEGEKIAGVWRVKPPDELSLQDVHKGNRPDATGHQPDTTGAQSDALFEQMRDERDYLRTKLDQALEEASELRQIAAAERERADVLQREALGRIEAITATIGRRSDTTVRQPDATGTRSEAVESMESGGKPLQGIRAWLRRLVSR